MENQLCRREGFVSLGDNPPSRGVLPQINFCFLQQCSPVSVWELVKKGSFANFSLPSVFPTTSGNVQNNFHAHPSMTTSCPVTASELQRLKNSLSKPAPKLERATLEDSPTFGEKLRQIDLIHDGPKWTWTWLLTTGFSPVTCLQCIWTSSPTESQNDLNVLVDGTATLRKTGRLSVPPTRWER